MVAPMAGCSISDNSVLRFINSCKVPKVALVENQRAVSGSSAPSDRADGISAAWRSLARQLLRPPLFGHRMQLPARTGIRLSGLHPAPLCSPSCLRNRMPTCTLNYPETQNCRKSGTQKNRILHHSHLCIYGFICALKPDFFRNLSAYHVHGWRPYQYPYHVDLSS